MGSIHADQLHTLRNQAGYNNAHTKGGIKDLPKNYRPVSLTSHIIKTFERIVAWKMFEMMESKDLMNDRQHGLRKGRSCQSQMLNHYQNLLQLMENGEAVDVIYLGFAKAFDKMLVKPR